MPHTSRSCRLIGWHCCHGGQLVIPSATSHLRTEVFLQLWAKPTGGVSYTFTQLPEVSWSHDYHVTCAAYMMCHSTLQWWDSFDCQRIRVFKHPDCQDHVHPHLTQPTKKADRPNFLGKCGWYLWHSSTLQTYVFKSTNLHNARIRFSPSPPSPPTLL